MNKNYYEVTRKARIKYYLELYSSIWFWIGYSSTISGSTLMMACPDGLSGPLFLIAGIIIYVTTKMRTARKNIY